MNADLPERFSRPNQSSVSPGRTKPHDLNGPSVHLNLAVREYSAAQHHITQKAESGDWRALPEIPTSAEITSSELIHLHPNKKEGKWKNELRYLKTQYELLREDSISPLREAVKLVRSDPAMMDSRTVRIYEKIHIAALTVGQSGIGVRIQFSTARSGLKIPWRSSQRLKSGSMVALTPADDNFQSKCVIAIVAARPIANLEAHPPMIDLYFANVDEIEIDPQVEWIMVEAVDGYFESSRHTLRALQKLSGECFPLNEQICRLVPELNVPTYLNGRPNVNLSAALSAEAQDLYDWRVDILKDWPGTPEATLDETQWDAMNQILTKNLAIIQGPPGTGKTHVSKIALQILAENRVKNEPPIIVAAHTNHALDQLLSHVSKFDPEYVRLGGRSTIPEVKKRALFEIRQKVRIAPIPGGFTGLASKRARAEGEKLQQILKPLNQRQNPFSAKTLFDLEAISKDQEESLIKGAKEWVSAGTESTNETQIWLGKVLVPFEVVYEPDNFGFEEADEDLEFEQLRELEAETGVADEEDIETLRFDFWCPVEDAWTVNISSETVLERARRQLDTVKDLWKAPQGLRGAMYHVMQQKAKISMTIKFREQAKFHQELVKQLQIGKWERDAVYLCKTNIIGITTTGLSKYRPLIASLKPKIILIEEAAEVLEAPITAACIPSLEHLILVGDHQQLKGRGSTRDLEDAPYYFNISMFERLVTNGMPFKTLLRQRRMDPEFRQLLTRIYPNLQDHSSLTTRKPLPQFGMGSVKSFFMDHDWTELKDEQKSTYNDKEAYFVVGFYRYLCLNGILPSDITILTFYNGQRKRILKYIRDSSVCNETTYHKVKTVDSYQGEENKIILLSLVRSNGDRQIGFLENDNRVCVALSRAQYGFYIFGSSSMLSGSTKFDGAKTELWTDVLGRLSERVPLGIGSAFPITCTKHQRTDHIINPEDWDNNSGGCNLPCEGSLVCGHICTSKCHPQERHDECQQICQKVQVCGHPCSKKCHEPCFCKCKEFTDAKNAWYQGLGEGNFPAGPSSNITHDVRNGNKNGNGAGMKNQNFRKGGNDSESRPMGQTRYKSSENLQQASSRLHNNKASGSSNQGTISNLSTSPIDSSIPVTPSASPRPSNSSRATTQSYSHSYFDSGIGLGSQYSPGEQDDSRIKWGSFANGGVKKDDLERAHARVMEQLLEPEADLRDAGDQMCVPNVPAEVKKLKNGREVVKEMYAPTALGPLPFGFSNTSPSKSAKPKSGATPYLESSLIG